MTYADPHQVLDQDDSLSRHHLAKKELRQKQLDDIPLKPGDRVLDIGIGPGLYLEYWLEATKDLGVNFTLLDLNPDFLKVCENIAKQTGNSDRVRLVQSDYFDLGSLQPESFDAVFIGNTLEYIKEPSDYLITSVLPLLSPKGLIAVRDLDCSFMRCSELDPSLNQRVVNSRIESGKMNTKTTGVFHDPFGGRNLGEVLKAANFSDVNLIHYPVVFRGPVSKEVRTYLAALHYQPGWYLENVDQSLSDDDITTWRAAFDPQDSSSILNSDQFYYEEAEFMALGRKP